MIYYPVIFRAYKQAAAIIFWITFQPISMIQRPNGFWTLLKKWSCRFCRFAMFSMDSACVGHLTARPLMATATAEGDDETAVMRLTVDDGSWRCGDYQKKLHHKWQWGLVNQVFLLRRWFLDVFSFISDGSTLMLWDRELLEVPCCSSVQLKVLSSSDRFFLLFFYFRESDKSYNLICSGSDQIAAGRICMSSL